MKMESLTKEDILLKDSLTYKELMKSLKLFGAIAILAFVVIILAGFRGGFLDESYDFVLHRKR